MPFFITQLIYLKPGAEETFDAFEALAIPIIAEYNGKLLMRLRPTRQSYIELNSEAPYEIHLCEFESEDDFRLFMKDERRNEFLHLKEASIRSAVMIKGEILR